MVDLFIVEAGKGLAPTCHQRPSCSGKIERKTIIIQEMSEQQAHLVQLVGIWEIGWMMNGWFAQRIGDISVYRVD
jgi:hypothetical protein